MGATRNLVLQQLLSKQRCTINDLAKAVKINPISVRHHITKLEAEGLVDSAEEKHGVGRPRRLYFLTERGREQFPSHTIRFTNQLLAELKEQLPADQFERIFAQMADTIAEQYANSEALGEMDIKGRLAVLREWLGKEGYSAQVQRGEKEILIKETSCPYYYVGQTHSEVCAIDKALIAKVLSVDPERTTCLLSGDSHCTYVVSLEDMEKVTAN